MRAVLGSVRKCWPRRFLGCFCSGRSKTPRLGFERESEDVAGIAAGEGAELLLLYTDAPGDEGGGVNQVLRLVPLRADRLRAQVRGVRLDQYALWIKSFKDFRGLTVLIGDVPGEPH